MDSKELSLLTTTQLNKLKADYTDRLASVSAMVEQGYSEMSPRLMEEMEEAIATLYLGWIAAIDEKLSEKL